jgi:hypothetical protein
VEVHVALTGSVQQTGSWRTLPSDDFSVTIQQTGHSLVYRWVLKAGRTVSPGQHVFAVQFNHATGTRSAAGDNYRVDAQGQAGGAVRGAWTCTCGAVKSMLYHLRVDLARRVPLRVLVPDFTEQIDVPGQVDAEGKIAAAPRFREHLSHMVVEHERSLKAHIGRMAARGQGGNSSESSR